MSHQTGIQRRSWKERALSLFLSAVMALGLVPGLTLSASAEHWADTYLDQLVDWGVLRADQTANPDAAITRADFMAVINRAYGYSEKGPIPFTDVQTTDWFYDDVSIAYTAGYMAGTSETTASPNDTLTREQAVCILGRNMMMKDTPGESLAFADSRDVSDWARGTVKTAVDNYIISGYPDNTFHPKASISKAQMAVLLTQCVGNPIQQSGTYEMGGVFGNVTITSPDVTLRNTTISGDLYVSGGVGLGGIKLENVNVLGRIIVSGGGESEGGKASVSMRNVTAEEMLVDNMRNKTVTVRADGITDIGKTTVRTNAYIEDNNTDSEGLMNIELDGESGTQLTLAGRIKDVVNKTPNSLIQVAKGSVAKLNVDEKAVNSVVQLDRNTTIKEMNLDVATNVTGDGDIDKLNVNAPGSVVAMLPDDIYIRPGLTANIAGVIMDHQAAEEGSLDPRLLSGYPAAKDITPTGLRADFAGNKKGTIYWAVSNITDGSIGEDDLITPPSYGSKAIRNGSIAAPTGGTEVNAQITGLTVGGSYYLSAILVDDQGDRSPVKVVSFSTPDNSVPAFGTGYPYMSFIGKANEYETMVTAQVAVMATKACKMYYAVLPAGAAAPTTDELRSAAIPSNLGYGVVDLEKNEVWDGDRAIIVSRRLEEQKNYVLYLWLTDGVNSSAVTNLAFTTPDVTAPIFVTYPQVNGDPQATSVPMSATINENGTIFWVVVESGANYPLPNPNDTGNKDNELDGKTAKLDSEYAKLQVANGMNAVSSGRMNAAGNTPTNLNITGLQAEKSYDIYFLIQDTAGNYSKSVYKLPGGIRTQDTGAPTVRQSFTRVDPQDNTRPMRDTSIVLEFSENVIMGSSGRDLLSLYADTQTGTGSERAAALDAFVNALRNNIGFYVMKNGRERLAVQGGVDPDRGPVSKDDWAIDYSKAKVTNVNGAVHITFPSGEDSLRLDSGATYFFRVSTDTQAPITDLSGHAMTPSPVDFDTPAASGHSLPKFTIVFARVDMTSENFELSGAEWPQAIAVENEANGALGIGSYQADFKFRLMPVDTESVADGIAYDLLLWSDTNIEYKLYYRAVTESGRVLTVERNGTQPGHWQYADMPNMGGVADDYGWIELGNGSGPHNIGATSNGRASKRLHYVFNNCQRDGDPLPDLKKMSSKLGNEEIYYDFIVSVHSINGRTDPNTWGETVKMYVDVAAGYSNNLFNLGSSPTMAKWQQFRDDGLNGGGGESIGSADRSENDTRQLLMTKSFQDKVQPSFQRGYPSFTTTEDSVTMSLSLDRPGTIYYVIGYAAQGQDVEPSNTALWTPTIGTTVGSGKTPIRPEQVPRNGSDRDNSSPPLPELSAPEKENIQNPSNWAEGLQVVPPGNVNCQSVAVQNVTINNLKPNRTYYVYFVITGTDVTPSEVEIYKFKTNPVSRPEITITANRGTNGQPGRATMSTNIGSELTYLIYPKSGVGSIPNINALLSSVQSTSLVLPTAYANMTIYQAIQTVYDYDTAKEGNANTNAYFPTDGSGDPGNYKHKYSVFDIYASDGAKSEMYAWLNKDWSSGTTNPGDNGGPTHLNANAALNSQSILLTDQTFFVIAMARKDPEDANTAQGTPATRYSFMGREITLGDQAPPQLEFVSGSLVLDSYDASDSTPNVTGLSIQLIFDKALYHKKDENDENPERLVDGKFFPHDVLGLDDTKTTISSGTNTATVTIPLETGKTFTGGSISATVEPGYLSNSRGVAAMANLSITSKIDSEVRQDAQYWYDRYYIEIKWEPMAGSGLTYKLDNTTLSVEVRRKKPVTPTPPAAETALGTVNLDAYSRDVTSGNLTVNFDKALYTEDGTPLSKANLASVFDTAEGINLKQSSVVNDTANDTARLELALQPGADKVAAKISSGSLTNSSGVGTEEDLVITGSEQKTTNGTTGLSVTKYDVNVYWGNEKLKTITGKAEK